MKYPECTRCGKIAVPILFVGNLTLAISKTVIGIVGNSSGLIADGAHSATDALSSVILFFGMRFAEKPADVEHPYGHRNVEFIIAKIISIFLLLVGIYILFSSVYKLSKGHFIIPEYITLGTAILSIFANELMYRYGTCVGTQINSPALLTNAYENKADAMSSIAISIGIVGAELGYPFLDPIAACIVSLLIIKSSIEMLKDSMDGLMDASLDTKVKQKIKNIINRIEDVHGIDFLRTRRVGRFISIEAGIILEAAMSIEDGDAIVREIRADIMNMVDNVGDVQIGISSTESSSDVIIEADDDEAVDDISFQTT